MFYYKVKDARTEEFICAASSDNFAWFKKSSQRFLRCDEERGQYLIVQNHIFLSKDMREPYPVHRDKYKWVKLELISKEEWLEIKDLKIIEELK